MMGSPTVSVVIPYHNDASTIGRAIESVLSQTFSDIEVVIVDDCSDPEAQEELKRFTSNRLEIVRHDVNRGAAAARNTGIRRAKGAYVAFLDADDSWRKNKIEAQLAAMQAVPANVVACVSGFAMHRGRDVTNNVAAPRHPLSDELVWGCRVCPGSTLICHRNCFDTLGFFDENLLRLEDWDWLLRFSRQYEIAYVAQVLTDVYPAPGKQPAHVNHVLDATERIRQKHQDMIAQLGTLNTRRFVSSLILENAAAQLRTGKRFAAALLVLHSLFTWPFRDRRFFSRMLQYVSRTPFLHPRD